MCVCVKRVERRACGDGCFEADVRLRRATHRRRRDVGVRTERTRTRRGVHGRGEGREGRVGASGVGASARGGERGGRTIHVCGRTASREPPGAITAARLGRARRLGARPVRRCGPLQARRAACRLPRRPRRPRRLPTGRPWRVRAPASSWRIRRRHTATTWWAKTRPGL